MLDSNKKNHLITEVCQFIENLPDTTLDQQTHPVPTVDLFTLCKEFIALKTEVKQESRQFKNALDSFKEVFNTLQKSHDVLASELAERREMQLTETQKQRQALLKPLLLDLIELRDCLEIGAINAKNHNASWFSRLFRRQVAFIDSLSEGQAMTLRRVDRMLSQYEVQTLMTLEQPFDPQYMRAVAIEERADLPDGVVVTETRKGFVWKNEVLRTAEVTVNKIKGTSP